MLCFNAVLGFWLAHRHGESNVGDARRLLGDRYVSDGLRVAESVLLVGMQSDMFRSLLASHPVVTYFGWQGACGRFLPCRLGICLLWMLLWLGIAQAGIWAQESANESISTEKRGDVAVAAAERFSGWIADAPPGIQRLIEAGRVTFTSDDQALAKAKKVGLTRFQVRGDYRYRYMTTAVRLDPVPPEPEVTHQDYVVGVSVRIFWTDVQMTHEVVLGSDFRPEFPWKSPLMQHEFDHVSTSTDPRLQLLVKEYLGAPLRFEYRWAAGNTEGAQVEGTSGRVDRKIAGEIEQSIRDRLAGRIKEVERIIQKHYDWLDQKTGHGRRGIDDRESFFAPFFMPETLEGMEFKEIEDSAIAKKLQAEVKWKEHYQWNSLP